MTHHHIYYYISCMNSILNQLLTPATISTPKHQSKGEGHPFALGKPSNQFKGHVLISPSVMIFSTVVGRSLSRIIPDI